MPQSTLDPYRNEQVDSKIEELKEEMRDDDWFETLKPTIINHAFEEVYEPITREEALDKIAEALIRDSHTRIHYVHNLANDIETPSEDDDSVAVAKRFFKQDLVEVFIEEYLDLQKELHKLKFKTDTDVVVEEDNGT